MSKCFRCWSFTLFINNKITGENYDVDCIDEQYEKHTNIVKYICHQSEDCPKTGERTYTYIYMKRERDIYIYIYIERERERERYR